LKQLNQTNNLTPKATTSSALGRAVTAKRRARNEASVFSDAQLEIIDICVRGAGAFGVSRSVGEIFGLLLCASKPMNFDDVVGSLGISSGSASHGLRRMCRLGVIRSCYVARDRRVHYVLETSLRSLVVALLEENLLVHLALADQQIQRLRARLNDDPTAGRFLIPQVELLANWNSQFRAALTPMLEALS
jgi:DNA-binding transcriptional regulator GbsR (MarR family)